jgi:hypothetical protein
MYCSIIKKTKLTNEEKLLKLSSNISKELLAIEEHKDLYKYFHIQQKKSKYH